MKIYILVLFLILFLGCIEPIDNLLNPKMCGNHSLGDNWAEPYYHNATVNGTVATFNSTCDCFCNLVDDEAQKACSC